MFSGLLGRIVWFVGAVFGIDRASGRFFWGKSGFFGGYFGIFYHIR